MICSRCLRRANARLLSSDVRVASSSSSFSPPIWRPDRRQRFSIQPPLSNQAVAESPSTKARGRTGNDAASPGGVPAATSTSAAQPFSTPLTPSPQAAGITAARPKPAKAIKSLIPAGAPLRGLNYLKDRNDPVALPDAEYPEWLWTCIEPTAGKKKSGGGDDGGGAAAGSLPSLSSFVHRWVCNRVWRGPDDERDIGQSTKKATGGKAARKLASMSGVESARQTVPLAEQSVDLPSNPRQDLEGAMQAANARDELTKALRVRRRGSIKEANFLKGMN